MKSIDSFRKFLSKSLRIFIELFDLFIGHLCKLGHFHLFITVSFYYLLQSHLFQKIYVSWRLLELFFNQGFLLTFFGLSPLFLLKIYKTGSDQDLGFFHVYFQMSFFILMIEMGVFCRLKCKILHLQTTYQLLFCTLF